MAVLGTCTGTIMRLAETTGVVMGGARTGDINNPKHVKTIGNPIRSKFFRCFGTVVVFAPGGQCFDFSEVRFSDLYRFFEHDFGTAQVFITNSWSASLPSCTRPVNGCGVVPCCNYVSFVFSSGLIRLLLKSALSIWGGYSETQLCDGG